MDESSLLSWLNRENHRLNESADKLLAIKVNDYDLHNQLVYVDLKLRYDSVMNSVCETHAIVAECMGNRSLLRVCISFVNKVSFLVCAFSSSVAEFEENMQWNK